jgi:type II pantothenate kinase
LEHARYHSSSREGTVVGVDVGTTLAKLAVRDGDGAPRFDLLSSSAPAVVAELVRSARPRRVGLTGGGSAELARLLPFDTARVSEFDAWRAGAAALLRAGPDERYLLVSIGTGTSVLLVDHGRVHRIGGTALGGGTVIGLGSRLVGTGDFGALCALAARGDRGRADLRVSDVYPGAGDAPLAADLTASTFARLARPDGAQARAEDLAHALMGMVGENVALIAGGLAAASHVQRMVFAGSTLRGNTALRGVLEDIVRRFGRTPEFLENGEFGGALGALLLADG